MHRLGSIHPESMFLMRFEDKIFWLQILEKGNGYTKFSLKGMELQEQSWKWDQSYYGVVEKSIQIFPQHGVYSDDHRRQNHTADCKGLLLVLFCVLTLFDIFALIQSENHASNKGNTAGRYQFDTHPTGIGLNTVYDQKLDNY